MIDPAKPEKKPSLQEERSRTTRGVIFAATIDCLDQFGYAETTYAKVQNLSGLSRGAITHHFPNKQALVTETAMNLLSNVLRPMRRREAEAEAPPAVYNLIMGGWKVMMASREGRAFVEILVSCRTDHDLRALLADQLQDWDQATGAAIGREYLGRDGDGDAELLWAITRSFFRGLIIHRQFVESDAYIKRMVERFARMMEREMDVRPTST